MNPLIRVIIDRTFVGLLLLTVALSGCLTLLGGEQRVGDQAALEVEAQVGRVRNAELEAYVQAIGRRLAAESGREGPWRFVVLDDPMPNAFALPGGHVYVTRGLLALVNEEDELAGVVGHEIGHVLAGHGGKRATLSAPFAILTGITSFATGLVIPRLGEAVSDAGHALSDGLVVAPFSRQQEREADRIGQKLAAQAGWDPVGISRFLRTLDRTTTLLLGEERRGGWLDTHPTTPERVRDTTRRAGTLIRVERAPIARGRADLLERIDGLLVGLDAAHGLPVGDRFVRPDWRVSIAWPSGWGSEGNALAIAAQPPSGDALILIRHVRDGDDARTAVRALEEEQGTEMGGEEVTLAGRPAVVIRGTQRSSQGRLYYEATWIAFSGRVLQMIAVCPDRDLEAWRPTFRDVAASLRAAQESELSSFRDRRLRSAASRAGETVSTFASRTDSDWTAEQIEVANALETAARLDEGMLLKITRSEPFTPRAR